MKKQYIIVGDNGFSYATTRRITKEQLGKVLNKICKNIRDCIYNNNSANELYTYEVSNKHLTTKID